MKRLHVHVRVAELPKSVSFYSTMFGTEPTVVKSDYAKWMLEDPRVNFAISSREGAEIGIEHLGIQAEDADELQDVYARLKAADGPVLEEGATTCCYAKSEKSWVSDPDGVLWEAFFTSGSATVYGDAKPLTLASDQAAAGACCTPDMASLGAERPAAKLSSSCGCS